MRLSVVSLAALASAASAANVFNGLSYNPKQLKNGACPTVDTVRDDLSVLRPYTNQIRIYSAKDCNQGEPVLRAIENSDWKVQIGMWVNKNDTVFESDLKEVIRLAKVFDFKKSVSAVIVGNEAIYRKEQTSAQMAAKVQDTKAALAQVGLSNIPVTVSETWPHYDKTLVDAVDYVNVHAFPFWEGSKIEDSQDKVFGHIYDIQKLAGNKKVVVGETGYPSAGGKYEDAVPSLENQQRYMKEFICRANLEKIDYVWFSAFDEAWKPTTNASDVETHWGVFNGDKSPKFKSPMYDCKGFVPNKPKSSASASDGASASKTAYKSRPTNSHSGSDLSGLEDEGLDSASRLVSEANGKGQSSKPNSAWSLSSGYSAAGIAASAAALVVSTFF